MPKRTDISSILIIGAASLASSACVNTRLFTEQELSAVGRACGVAEGEVVQETDYPRFLFLYAVGPSQRQLSCIRRWSRRHNMNLAYIEAVEWNNQ